MIIIAMSHYRAENIDILILIEMSCEHYRIPDRECPVVDSRGLDGFERE